jgi:cytochrome c2
MELKSFALLVAFAANLLLPCATRAADIAAGRALAEQWYVKCHNIEKGVPFKLHPPSFASIATYRQANDIRDKIISPHIGMVDITWVLQAEDLDKLVSYITSLETK